MIRRETSSKPSPTVRTFDSTRGCGQVYMYVYEFRIKPCADVPDWQDISEVSILHVRRERRRRGRRQGQRRHGQVGSRPRQPHADSSSQSAYVDDPSHLALDADARLPLPQPRGGGGGVGVGHARARGTCGACMSADGAGTPGGRPDPIRVG
jgi:hypothetical protein